ncbi:hypothetical protein SDC9_140861 [bioreactor metagenome]|uniref:Twitching motility protein PilT n=1 Tax=bioreactor metagenome TaxID=1076179 RepID=A0A645DWR7_9ZZZZ|nr:hypothetical protein [Candidatus Pelethousia sp.]
MIQVIFGEKGAGKTKQILDMANESTKTARGSIVFVADDGQYMFGLKRDIRFVDASSFHIDGPKMFYGFLCGIAAQDFDLEYIYIDGFLKIVRHSLATLETMFHELDVFSKRSGIHIVVSISGDASQVPEFLKQYIQ